jgi:hypothetical protein
MKIMAYVCCDELGCDARELADVSVAFRDNKACLDGAVPDGWEYWSEDRYSDAVNYCPSHRRRSAKK